MSVRDIHDDDARHRLLAIAGLVVFGCCWGATIPLTKISVSTGHHPLGLIFWQFVMTGGALGLLAAVRRLPLRVAPKYLLFYVVIALIGTLVPNSFSFLAIRHLPAGIVALAIATIPMMAFCVALLFGNERFRPRRLLGIALGVSAMMLIVLPQASLPDAAMIPWVGVALLAPLCYAFEGNYMDRFAPGDVHPVPGLFGACMIGAMIAAPLAWFSGSWIDLSQAWTRAEYALLGSSLAHAAAYSGYLWLVRHAGIVFSSQVAYVVTGASILFSIVFLGERYSLWVWGAIALMLAGLSLVQPRRKASEAETA